MGLLYLYQNRWVINTNKAFKSAGTDGIAPALLQQGTGQLADICAVYLQPVWQEGTYPQPVDKLR
jgi:hypothetical protein